MVLLCSICTGRVDGGTNTALWNVCFFCSFAESGVEGIESQLTDDKRAERRDENERPHDVMVDVGCVFVVTSW